MRTVTTLTLTPLHAMCIASGIHESFYSRTNIGAMKDVLLCSTSSYAERGSIPGSAIALIDIDDAVKINKIYRFPVTNVRILEPFKVHTGFWLGTLDNVPELNICPEYEDEKDQLEWERKYFIPHVMGATHQNGVWRYPYLYE